MQTPKSPKQIKRKLKLISSREPKMHCLKVKCNKCLKEREIMTEHDQIDDYVCTVCILADKNAGKTIKVLDGAPRGYVKGTDNPCKN